MRNKSNDAESRWTICPRLWSHKLVSGLIRDDTQELAASLASERGIGQHADGANANQRIYSAIRIADYIMNGAKAVTTVSRCSRGSPASLGTELLHNVGAGAIHPTSRWTLCAEWDAAVKARYASGNRTDDAIIRYRPATAPSAPDPGSSPPTLRGTADRPWCRPDRRCCQGRT